MDACTNGSHDHRFELVLSTGCQLPFSRRQTVRFDGLVRFRLYAPISRNALVQQREHPGQ